MQRQHAMARRALLACGILSTALYASLDVISGLRYDGYSFASRAVSELSAVGAPTRSLWTAWGPVYQILVILFGCGVWASAGGKRALRIVSGLLVTFGLFGFSWAFFPMHQREVLAAAGPAITDTMHKILSLVTVVFLLSIIGFGAAAGGKRFRLYSIATIVLLGVFGALTGQDAPRIEANLPTPWVGVTERLIVYAPMLWFAALVIALWKRSEALTARMGIQ